MHILMDLEVRRHRDCPSVDEIDQRTITPLNIDSLSRIVSAYACVFVFVRMHKDAQGKDGQLRFDRFDRFGSAIHLTGLNVRSWGRSLRESQRELIS